MQFEPHSVDLSSWHALLAGSAHRVLKRRANARPRKAQSVHDVATSDALGLLGPCEAELLRMTTGIERMRATIDTRYLATDEARVCFRDAWGSVQPGKCNTHTTEPCCITNAGASVRVFEMSRADWSTSAHAVSKPWHSWLEACMVVGGAVGWMDERVEAWLRAHPAELNEREQMTRQTIIHLLQHPPMEHLRQAFNYASEYLVRRVVSE